jgi:hypothetical protein
MTTQMQPVQASDLTVGVLGWRLHAPSASGGKVYVVVVADNMTVVGWGKKSASTTGLQFKVARHANAAAAQAFAHAMTSDKERSGYTMDVTPRYAETVGTKVLALAERVNVRGADPYLQESVNYLLSRPAF